MAFNSWDTIASLYFTKDQPYCSWITKLSSKPIKINNKYLIDVKKNQNPDKESRKYCKILQFAEDLNVLEFIKILKPSEYPNLFVFILNEPFGTENEEIKNIKEQLINFGRDRLLILQITSSDENKSTIFYKLESSEKFVEINGENEIIKEFTQNYSKLQYSSIVLRLLRTLDLSKEFTQELILKYAACGSKNEFLAALGAPFENKGRVLDSDSQKYLSTVFEAEEFSGMTSSVLLTAVKNKNTEVINYLITYWSHLIQQLPFEHQIQISTVAFETGQPDVLCDLLDFADFPFPENFKVDNEKDHKTLGDIVLERKEFHKAIKEENFGKIDQFINTKPSPKKFFNTENRSVLYHASELRKFGVFYYLKSLGFYEENCDHIISKLNVGERVKAHRQAENQWNKSNFSLASQHKSVFLLATKSSIHNRRISKEQEEEYREKINKWFEDIYKIAPELLDVAASCKDLKIIFDFESESVKNACLLESMFPKREFILVGAKMSTENREQQIKGVLAHELCHVVMKLVYDNQEKPYHKLNKTGITIFGDIVRSIDKWSVNDSEDSDDECGGIISSVYKDYDSKDFHSELIAGAVEILAEFDDNPEKSCYLQEKYKILFDYWENQVILEFQNYLQKNKNLIKLNRHFGLLNTIQESQNLKTCEPNVTDKLTDTKMTILSTNVPRLLLVEMAYYLWEKDGVLFDSLNLFVDPLKLENMDIWKNFGQALSLNSKIINVFVDCTKGFNVNGLKHNFIKEHNFIFVIRTECQHKKTLRKLARKLKIVPKIVEKNYKWSDLTEESQEMLLQTKIKFQNHPQIILNDLLDKDKKLTTIIRDFSNMIDDQLLNLLVQKQEISINAKLESEYGKNFELLFKPRKFIRQHNKEADKLSEDELLSEVTNTQYVLISDIARSGKSWAMKNIAKSLRKKNPTNWVTYIDLKQFIDEFKTQKGELEFETFMVEHILKLYHQFEANIFKKMYKDGKLFILFDGFDEIAPNYAEFVSKLAQNFQWNGGNQLWIATRDYFEVDLQDKLKIDVVYSLDEMTENDGVEYIAKSWVLMDLIKNKNEPKSREIFSKCIEMSSKYENYSQKARQIIQAIIPGKSLLGLPQLLKMIADIFKDEGDMKYTSKFDIFNRLINVLYVRWAHQKGQIRENASFESQKFDISFFEFHRIQAVASLFPEHTKELFPDYDGSEWPAEEIIAGGIMNIKDGKICFIHETLRDFFVADLIINELRLSTQRKLVLDIFVKILTNRSYSAIQIFLNDAVKSEPALMSNLEHKLLEYADEFCKMDNFEDYFINDIERLTKMIMNILKSGNYMNLKELLTKSAPKVIESIENPCKYKEFERFLFKSLKSEDIKALFKDEEILHRIVQSNLPMDVLHYSVENIAGVYGLKFIKEVLSTKSVTLDGNIIFLACTSACKEYPKISRCVYILQHFFTSSEIIEQLSDCNQRGESVLQVCAQRSSDVFKFLIFELEKFTSSNEFRHLLNTLGEFDQNILQLAAKNNNSIELHELLWKILLKYFERSQIEKVIKHNDELEENVLMKAAKYNSKEIVQFTWNKIKKILSQNDQVQYLKIIGHKDKNILEASLKNTKNYEVYEYIRTLYQEYKLIDEDFYMSEEVDDEMEVDSENSDEQSTSDFIRKDFMFLIDAVKENNLSKVVKLLKTEIDVNCVDRHYLSAIDYAWINYIDESNSKSELRKIEKILMLLLRSNSKFPNRRVDFDYDEEPEEIKDFIDFTDQLKETVKQYPNLSYFIENNNENVLLYALRKQRRIVRNKINSHLPIPRVSSKMEIDDSSDLKDKFPHTNVLAILLKSRIGDAKRHIMRFNVVDHALRTINKINNCSEILKVCAAWRDLKIYFDFESSSNIQNHQLSDQNEVINIAVKNLLYNEKKKWEVGEAVDLTRRLPKCQVFNLHVVLPVSTKNTAGDRSGVGICTSKNILREDHKQPRNSRHTTCYLQNQSVQRNQQYEQEEKNKVLGEIIHELCHQAIQLTYMNNSNPYPNGESKQKQKYEDIFNSIKERFEEKRKFDGIIKDVFTNKPEHQHAELIVRPVHLVMHYYKNSEQIFKQQKMFKELFDFLEDIIICDLKEALPVLKKMQNRRWGVSFDDLTEPLKARILHSKVSFQGKEAKLFDLVGDDLDILKVLTFQEIRKILLKNEVLEIINDLNLDLSRCIISRKLILSSDELPGCEKSLANIEEEINLTKYFVLSDCAGTGKTVIFEKLAVNLNERFPSFGVFLLKLKNYRDVLRKYKTNFEILQTKDILLQLLKIDKSLEIQIFNSLYNNGKLIILFDGFDEIAPEFSELFLRIFKDLRQKTKFTILISTRPHCTDNLGNDCTFSSYKLISFTKDERIEFLNEILKDSLNSNTISNLKSFFEMIDQNESHIDNLLTLRIIAELYIKSEESFDKESINLFKNFKTIVNDMKENLYIKIPFEDKLIKTRLTSVEMHNVFALKNVFQNENDHELELLINSLALFKNWAKDATNWTVDKIQRFGFVTKKSSDNNFSFVHKTIAEYFVAEYFISFLFDDNNCVKKEEHEKMFKLLRIVARSPDNFDVVRKFIFSYVDGNQFIEVCSKFKKIILNNLIEIFKDVLESENCLEVFKFWLILLPAECMPVINFIHGDDDDDDEAMSELSIEILCQRITEILKTFDPR